MKNFIKLFNFRNMLKPMATLILFFSLIISANAQVVSENSITPPAEVSGTGSLNPGIIVGSNVTITNDLGSTCPNVKYKWQSATDEYFTQNFISNLANTKDYDPGILTVTTYFRRVVSVDCNEPDRGVESKTGSIKFTIN